MISDAIAPFTDPKNVLLSITKRHIMTLLVMTRFYRDTSGWTLPPEMTSLVIYFLIYSVPQRGVDPINGIRQIMKNCTAEMRQYRNSNFSLFGSSILNHLSRRQDDHGKWVGGNHYPGDWDIFLPHSSMDIPIIDTFFEGLPTTSQVIVDNVNSRIFEKTYGPWKFNLVNYIHPREMALDVLECEVCYFSYADIFTSIYQYYDEFPRDWRMNELHYNFICPEKLLSMGSRHLNFKALTAILMDRRNMLLDDQMIDRYLVIQERRRAKYERFCEINQLKMIIEVLDNERDIFRIVSYASGYNRPGVLKWGQP